MHLPEANISNNKDDMSLTNLGIIILMFITVLGLVEIYYRKVYLRNMRNWHIDNGYDYKGVIVG